VKDWTAVMVGFKLNPVSASASNNSTGDPSFWFDIDINKIDNDEPERAKIDCEHWGKGWKTHKRMFKLERSGHTDGHWLYVQGNSRIAQLRISTGDANFKCLREEHRDFKKHVFKKRGVFATKLQMDKPLIITKTLSSAMPEESKHNDDEKSIFVYRPKTRQTTGFSLEFIQQQDEKDTDAECLKSGDWFAVRDDAVYTMNRVDLKKNFNDIWDDGKTFSWLDAWYHYEERNSSAQQLPADSSTSIDGEGSFGPVIQL